MSYQSPYQAFIFEDYSFDSASATATFRYSFDGVRKFTERVTFKDLIGKEAVTYNTNALEAALALSFYTVATSYYKCFPTQKVIFKKGVPNQHQAEFLQTVYTHGLSQFLFENNLTQDDIAVFSGDNSEEQTMQNYSGTGILALQSGGKDSLLTATLLEEAGTPYKSIYMSSTDVFPDVLSSISVAPRIIKRTIDTEALKQAVADGGLSGHVPITYIVESFALIDAILHNEKTILTSIGNEGEEPHEHIGDLPVNHQWSKTWTAEQMLSDYVTKYIGDGLQVGSPLRGYSELRIAELFVQKCWNKFGHSFSSCNRANYKQGAQNQHLTWCGECPKCANSYLLFAPFVEPHELQNLFGGQDLFAKPELIETFKGLLGIDDVMKPFECVGEVEELRLAYHMALEKNKANLRPLMFDVPESEFDFRARRPIQKWTEKFQAAL